MRPLGGESEVRAYVALHRSVFETKNMTLAWRRRTLCQPAYNPQTDMVIADSAGKLVAFCVGWLGMSSTGEKIGQIEPLGCDVKVRGLGLARSALVETIRRLRQLGACRVYVETDANRHSALGLNDSVGFQVVKDVLVYRKDYNDSST